MPLTTAIPGTTNWKKSCTIWKMSSRKSTEPIWRRYSRKCITIIARRTTSCCLSHTWEMVYLWKSNAGRKKKRDSSWKPIHCASCSEQARIRTKWSGRLDRTAISLGEPKLFANAFYHVAGDHARFLFTLLQLFFEQRCVLVIKIESFALFRLTS